MMITPVVIVHGGAGRVPPQTLPQHVAGCGPAAAAGLAVLEKGGSVIEAVERAVIVLEDAPLYNAGTGASLRRDGTIELDASIMEGRDLRAGAVCALPPFRNPISIARAVMDKHRHLLLSGHGAARFAMEAGFAPSSLDELRTDKATARLASWNEGRVGEGWAGGTVGAVAVDSEGNVAAATSTGGTVGAEPGRVGDTPLIGAGTWADNQGGACSTTGIGEHIIRVGLARTPAELFKQGATAQEAAQQAIATLDRISGSAGLIYVAPNGEVGIARNTATMSHAMARSGQAVTTAS